MLRQRQPKIRVFAKNISLLVVLSLIIPHLAWAFEPALARAGEIVFNQSYVGIPHKLGTTLAAHQGQKRLIVYIQDLHCNYEVQSNISHMLDKLAQQAGLTLVGIEGASTRLDLSKLSSFPIESVKKRSTDFLLRQGKITGMESYAAVGRHPVVLEGLEDAGLYQDNARAVMKILNDENQGWLLELREALNEIKPQIYTASLAGMDQQKQDWREGRQTLLAYAAWLAGMAAQERIDPKLFPNLECYLASKQDVFSGEVDSENLLQDLENLDARLRGKKYTSQAQRELDDLEQRLNVMEKLLNISATPVELAEFRQQPGNFTVQAFRAYLASHDPEVAGSLDPETDRLNMALEQAREFYAVADQRSMAFVRNLEQRMDQHKTDIAVMVTGGYHAPEIQAELEKRGWSYLCVKPALTRQDVVNPYFSLLKGRKTPLEKLLDQNQNIFQIARPFRAANAGQTTAEVRLMENEADQLSKACTVVETFSHSAQDPRAVQAQCAQVFAAWTRNNPEIALTHIAANPSSPNMVGYFNTGVAVVGAQGALPLAGSSCLADLGEEQGMSANLVSAETAQANEAKILAETRGNNVWLRAAMAILEFPVDVFLFVAKLLGFPQLEAAWKAWHKTGEQYQKLFETFSEKLYVRTIGALIAGAVIGLAVFGASQLGLPMAQQLLEHHTLATVLLETSLLTGFAVYVSLHLPHNLKNPLASRNIARGIMAGLPESSESEPKQVEQDARLKQLAIDVLLDIGNPALELLKPVLPNDFERQKKLVRILKDLLGTETIDVLDRKLRDIHSAEFQQYLEAVVANNIIFHETKPGRYPLQDLFLRVFVLPELIRNKIASHEHSLRIGSLGTSEGFDLRETALAIEDVLLAEGEKPENWRIVLEGRDISQRMLTIARDVTLAGLPPEFKVETYITALGRKTDQREIAGTHYDVLICRAAAGYLRPEVRRQLANGLYTDVFVADGMLPMDLGRYHQIYPQIYQGANASFKRIEVSEQDLSHLPRNENGREVMLQIREFNARRANPASMLHNLPGVDKNSLGYQLYLALGVGFVERFVSVPLIGRWITSALNWGMWNLLPNVLAARPKLTFSDFILQTPEETTGKAYNWTLYITSGGALLAALGAWMSLVPWVAVVLLASIPLLMEWVRLSSLTAAEGHADRTAEQKESLRWFFGIMTVALLAPAIITLAATGSPDKALTTLLWSYITTVAVQNIRDVLAVNEPRVDAAGASSVQTMAVSAPAPNTAILFQPAPVLRLAGWQRFWILLTEAVQVWRLAHGKVDVGKLNADSELASLAMAACAANKIELQSYYAHPDQIQFAVLSFWKQGPWIWLRGQLFGYAVAGRGRTTFYLPHYLCRAVLSRSAESGQDLTRRYFQHMAWLAGRQAAIRQVRNAGVMARQEFVYAVFQTLCNRQAEVYINAALDTTVQNTIEWLGFAGLCQELGIPLIEIAPLNPNHPSYHLLPAGCQNRSLAIPKIWLEATPHRQHVLGWILHHLDNGMFKVLPRHQQLFQRRLPMRLGSMA